MTQKIRVLLAGESWFSSGVHVKGFDRFTTAEFQTGIALLKEALAGTEVALTHMPGHLVPTEFPQTREDLDALHPDTFIRGQRTPNRLALISDWVGAGGGFLMVGGYLSYQGIGGTARYHRTPIEQILPVEMLSFDDRVEAPEGFTPFSTKAKDHPHPRGH